MEKLCFLVAAGTPGQESGRGARKEQEVVGDEVDVAVTLANAAPRLPPLAFNNSAGAGDSARGPWCEVAVTGSSLVLITRLHTYIKEQKARAARCQTGREAGAAGVTSNSGKPLFILGIHQDQ